MRDVTSVGAYTAAVLSARKILMHVAVDKGAPTNERFVVYVKFLGDKGYTPAGSEGWVDYIRKRSNDANHEIEIMTAEDAQALVTFTTQLLRNVYELPLSVPSFESGEPEEAGEEEPSAQE